MKIPRLGQKVYISYDDFIVLEKVEMKGKENFATRLTFDDLMIEKCRQPIYYEDYGTKWFTSLSEAKKSIELNEDECIVKCSDHYWEIQNKGE